jgi:hypothetical protein
LYAFPRNVGDTFEINNHVQQALILPGQLDSFQCNLLTLANGSNGNYVYGMEYRALYCCLQVRRETNALIKAQCEEIKRLNIEAAETCILYEVLGFFVNSLSRP